MPYELRYLLPILLTLLCCRQVATADPLSANQASLTELISTAAYSNGAPQDVQASPGGKEVYFLRSGPHDTLHCLFALDTQSGISRKLLESSALGDPKVGINEFQLSPNGSKILIPFEGKIYLINTADRRLLSFSGSGYLDPELSPDGNKVVAVKAGDLWCIDVSDGATKRLTLGGSALILNGAPSRADQTFLGRKQGFWWSPDGRSIGYVQTDLTKVSLAYPITFQDPNYAVAGVRHSLPGGIMPTLRFGIVNIDGGKTSWIAFDSARYPYIVRADWRRMHAPLTVVLLSRDQRTELVETVSPLNGKFSTLLTEFDHSWVDIAPDVYHATANLSPYWLSDGSGFLWLTRRHGDWQIELRDKDGLFLRDVTPLGLHVRSIDGIDEKQGSITFDASPDPRQCQIYQTDFRGGPCVPKTHGIGLHYASLSADSTVYTDTYSLDDGETGVDVYSVTTDFRIARLPTLADSMQNLPNVHYFKLGKFEEIDVAAVLPSGFKKQMHYPVLLHAGIVPGQETVTTGVAGYVDDQWYADQGFIVLNIDGAGAPNRGKENETAIKGDLVDKPIQNMVDTLIDIAKQLPQVDLSRVAVVGQGVAGATAVVAAIRRPDLFACAVVISPVADWRVAEAPLAERYLGSPSANMSQYLGSSPTTYTSHLQHPMLLLQSAADDSFGCAGALKLAAELYRSGRPIDFVPVAGSLEGYGSPVDVMAEHTRILQFITAQLEP